MLFSGGQGVSRRARSMRRAYRAHDRARTRSDHAPRGAESEWIQRQIMP
jgi:hypothetical protein